MRPNAFTDGEAIPDDISLEKALGPVFRDYTDLMRLCAGWRFAWRHGKSSGWLLKVHDGRKALFWLSPLEGGFRLNFALREKERKTLLSAKLRKTWKADLQGAQKFPEGYAFRIEIVTRPQYKEARKIVSAVMEAR